MWCRDALALTGIALLAACASLGAPAIPATPDLDEAALRSSMVGKKLEGRGYDMGYPITTVGSWNPDGTIEADWSSGGKSGHYSGAWKIDGTKICTTNKNPADGPGRCETIRQQDGKFWEINPDGSLHWINAIAK